MWTKKMFPKEVNKVKRSENVKQMYMKDVDGILLTGKVSVCEYLTSKVAGWVLAASGTAGCAAMWTANISRERVSLI